MQLTPRETHIIPNSIQVGTIVRLVKDGFLPSGHDFLKEGTLAFVTELFKYNGNGDWRINVRNAHGDTTGDFLGFMVDRFQPAVHDSLGLVDMGTIAQVLPNPFEVGDEAYVVWSRDGLGDAAIPVHKRVTITGVDDNCVSTDAETLHSFPHRYHSRFRKLTPGDVVAEELLDEILEEEAAEHPAITAGRVTTATELIRSTQGRVFGAKVTSRTSGEERTFNCKTCVDSFKAENLAKNNMVVIEVNATNAARRANPDAPLQFRTIALENVLSLRVNGADFDLS